MNQRRERRENGTPCNPQLTRPDIAVGPRGQPAPFPGKTLGTARNLGRGRGLLAAGHSHAQVPRPPAAPHQDRRCVHSCRLRGDGTSRPPPCLPPGLPRTREPSFLALGAPLLDPPMDNQSPAVPILTRSRPLPGSRLRPRCSLVILTYDLGQLLPAERDPGKLHADTTEASAQALWRLLPPQ